MRGRVNGSGSCCIRGSVRRSLTVTFLIAITKEGQCFGISTGITIRNTLCVRKHKRRKPPRTTKGIPLTCVLQGKGDLRAFPKAINLLPKAHDKTATLPDDPKKAYAGIKHNKRPGSCFRVKETGETLIKGSKHIVQQLSQHWALLSEQSICFITYGGHA
jgi:hypothetical protein